MKPGEAHACSAAGFDAVDPADNAKQVVVVAHRHATIDKLLRREIFVVVRKPLLDRAPKQRLVSRGAVLVVVRKVRGVHIVGVAHAFSTHEPLRS